MYWNTELNEAYSGDKINWLDVSLSSDRPSSLHTPVIENGVHTGEWSETLSPPNIEVVSRAQGTAQLQLSGYWDTVVALVEAIPNPSTKIIAKQALYAANTWQKNSPTMQLLAGEDGLNLTQQQFDDLFINANQIQL